MKPNRCKNKVKSSIDAEALMEDALKRYFKFFNLNLFLGFFKTIIFKDSIIFLDV